MAYILIFLITIGAFLLLLFLYSLLKISQISDLQAGYDEGVLYQGSMKEVSEEEAGTI